MKEMFLVGVGGFAGSMLRYGVSLVIKALGASLSFPAATFSVNFTGSFLIGILITLLSGQDEAGLLFYLGVAGFCGGFTTFSAFSFETLALFRSGNTGMAFTYIAASIVLCLAATWLGMQLGMKFK